MSDEIERITVTAERPKTLSDSGGGGSFFGFELTLDPSLGPVGPSGTNLFDYVPPFPDSFQQKVPEEAPDPLEQYYDLFQNFPLRTETAFLEYDQEGKISNNYGSETAIGVWADVDF